MQEDKEKEMTKDVVVSLKGLQLAPDQQSDASEDVCECAEADEQEAEQAEVTAETAEA